MKKEPGMKRSAIPGFKRGNENYHYAAI